MIFPGTISARPCVASLDGGKGVDKSKGVDGGQGDDNDNDGDGGDSDGGDSDGGSKECCSEDGNGNVNGGDKSAGAVDVSDQKHPTPLQLEIIENCVDLWSNPGETVLDPFSGIGSTGFVCRKLGRKYVGVELVPAYFAASLQNV